MPEVQDVDSNYIYWQPDGGGAIQRTARTPETDAQFSIANPASAPAATPMSDPAPQDIPLGDTRLGAAAKTVGGAIGSAGQAISDVVSGPLISNRIGHAASDYLLQPAAGKEPETVGQQQARALTPPAPFESIAPVKPAENPAAPQVGAVSGHHPLAGPSSSSELFKAMREEKKATGQIIDLQKQAEDEKAFAMAVDANARDKFQADQAIKQADRDRAVKEGNAQLDAMNKEVREGKIDPDGFFGGDSGTAKRIGAAIAVALGQFAASMTGGQNAAMGIINDSIQRNIEAQKKNLAQKGLAADAQRSKLQMLREQGFDENQAEQATFLGGLEASKAKLAATLQASSSDAVRANGAKLMAQMDQNIAQTKLKFEAASRAAALKYQPKSFDDLIKKQKLDHEMSRDKAERMIRMADGSTAFAPTKEDATSIKESDENRIAMTSNLDRLKQIVKDKSSWTDRATRDEAKRISKELVTSYGVMKKLGALSDSDRELADQFRDPNSLFTGDDKIIDSINKYAGRINAGHNAKLQSRLVTE